MSDLSYPPVQQAMKKLQDLSRNEQDRYRALARDKALYDELSLLNDAREEPAARPGRPQPRPRRNACLTDNRSSPLAPHAPINEYRGQATVASQIPPW